VVTKSPEAFRTISEVADALDVPPHVLRFWESRFAQVKPVKRGGGRRYYRPEDVCLLRGIRGLLYDDGMTIKGVQKILREKGVRHVVGLGAEDGTLLDGAAAITVTGASEAGSESGSAPAGPARVGQEDLFDSHSRPAAELVTGFAEAAVLDITAAPDQGILSRNRPTEEANMDQTGAATGAEAPVAEETETAIESAADGRDKPADAPKRARKEALKALVAEFKALRERMTEVMPK
jgi:DNA-binding transcriptional MerR regulator